MPNANPAILQMAWTARREYRPMAGKKDMERKRNDRMRMP